MSIASKYLFDIKVRNCPFCGGEAVVGYDEDKIMRPIFSVCCNNSACKILPYTFWRYSLEEAVSDWNGVDYEEEV